MNILALDTSTRTLSVALLRDDGEAFALSDDSGKFTELLIPMVVEVLDSAEVSKADIGGIAVTIGPGSFTGLRVGISTAKGFAHSLNIPVVSVNRFESMLGSLSEDDFPAVAIIPYKDEKISFARFEKKVIGSVVGGGKSGTYNTLSDELIGVKTLLGQFLENDMEQIKGSFPGDINIVKYAQNAFSAAKTGKYLFENSESDSLDELDPIYAHSIVFKERKSSV